MDFVFLESEDIQAFAKDGEVFINLTAMKYDVQLYNDKNGKSFDDTDLFFLCADLKGLEIHEMGHIFNPDPKICTEESHHNIINLCMWCYFTHFYMGRYEHNFYKKSTINYYSKPKIISSDQSLENIIYGFVRKVTDIDFRGYQMNVCIQRVHLQTGISKETIFKEVMKMISQGLLFRSSVEGGVFLRPPSAVTAIADVLKKKVLT
ncbi:MAG: hypothetical protein PHV30_09170 [Candidatus Margulisbacteria bacterium]|nr:hypothetical protein [Candidatus Margulisiibacteriota bacterium]